MSEQTLTIAGLLALLLLAMLILAALALTLRGFQTLSATIVTLLRLGLRERPEGLAPEGERTARNRPIVAQYPDPPLEFDDPPADLLGPPDPPPSRPSTPNGRGKV